MAKVGCDRDGRQDLVALEGVGKRYGAHPVVSDVSLGVRPGECLALLGHNGAGKTTLFKLILGLIPASEGLVRVAGAEPGSTAFHDIRRTIGFLPESVAFQDAMTGREVLEFYARLKQVALEECDRLLERMGLIDAAGRRVQTYSKGMRQRLGLAQALLGEPRLLLLDEPTTGLDPELRRQFFDIVDGMARVGTAVIISSHALTEIEAHADRYAIINEGRLAALGTLGEMKRQAGLPLRFRLTFPSGKAKAAAKALNGSCNLAKVNDKHIYLNCPEAEKMSVLRSISALSDPAQDVEIEPPRLEDLYAHFTGWERRQ